MSSLFIGLAAFTLMGLPILTLAAFVYGIMKCIHGMEKLNPEGRVAY